MNDKPTHRNGLHFILILILFLRFKMYVLKCVLRVVWVVLNNIYVIPAYFTWLILFRPILWFKPKLYWQIEDIFFGWLLTMVACWNYTAGYEVFESGDRLEDIAHKRFLFMPNHQSTADVPLCMTIFAARWEWARAMTPNFTVFHLNC